MYTLIYENRRKAQYLFSERVFWRMTQDEKNSEQGEIAQSGMVFKSIRQRPRPTRLVLLQQAPRPNNVSRPTVVAYTHLIVLEI